MRFPIGKVLTTSVVALDAPVEHTHVVAGNAFDPGQVFYGKSADCPLCRAKEAGARTLAWLAERLDDTRTVCPCACCLDARFCHCFSDYQEPERCDCAFCVSAMAGISSAANNADTQSAASDDDD